MSNFFAEAFAERSHTARASISDPSIDESHHRQRRLLRARRQRPMQRGMIVSTT